MTLPSPTSNKDEARSNVLFFLESGFFDGQEERIKQALDKFAPVLPSSSPSQHYDPCSMGNVGAVCANGMGVCDHYGMCVPRAPK